MNQRTGGHGTAPDSASIGAGSERTERRDRTTTRQYVRMARMRHLCVRATCASPRLTSSVHRRRRCPRTTPGRKSLRSPRYKPPRADQRRDQHLRSARGGSTRVRRGSVSSGHRSHVSRDIVHTSREGCRRGDTTVSLTLHSPPSSPLRADAVGGSIGGMPCGPINHLSEVVSVRNARRRPLG
jgi:hypothetical protein